VEAYLRVLLDINVQYLLVFLKELQIVVISLELRALVDGHLTTLCHDASSFTQQVYAVYTRVRARLRSNMGVQALKRILRSACKVFTDALDLRAIQRTVPIRDRPLCEPHLG
jgi:hypothetical protein